MVNIFSKYKFIFYLLNFVLIFLYLFPGSFLGCILYDDCKKQPQITPDFIISTNHLYAFLFVSFIGFLTYKKKTQLKKLSIYLILLSIILELFHYIIPDRSFESSDLFGNFLGVIIVIVFDFFLKKYENFEH